MRVQGQNNQQTLGRTSCYSIGKAIKWTVGAAAIVFVGKKMYDYSTFTFELRGEEEKLANECRAFKWRFQKDVTPEIFEQEIKAGSKLLAQIDALRERGGFSDSFMNHERRIIERNLEWMSEALQEEGIRIKQKNERDLRDLLNREVKIYIEKTKKKDRTLEEVTNSIKEGEALLEKVNEHNEKNKFKVFTVLDITISLEKQTKDRLSASEETHEVPTVEQFMQDEQKIFDSGVCLAEDCKEIGDCIERQRSGPLHAADITFLRACGDIMAVKREKESITAAQYHSEGAARAVCVAEQCEKIGKCYFNSLANGYPGEESYFLCQHWKELEQPIYN